MEMGVSAPFEKRKRTVFWNPGTVPKEQIVEASASRRLDVFCLCGTAPFQKQSKETHESGLEFFNNNNKKTLLR